MENTEWIHLAPHRFHPCVIPIVHAGPVLVAIRDKPSQKIMLNCVLHPHYDGEVNANVSVKLPYVLQSSQNVMLKVYFYFHNCDNKQRFFMKRRLRRTPQKTRPHPAAVQKLPTDLSKVRINPIKPQPYRSSLVGALLIGIEYAEYAEQQKMSRLPGCHTDVRALKQLLISRYCLTEFQIMSLTDEKEAKPDQMPTRQNIEQSITKLVALAQNASKGGKLLFYYSGHGTQQTDQNHDEKDNADECVVPSDFQEAGIITDDVLSDMLFAKLPSTSSCVAIVDACNSGSMFDLPFLYNGDTKQWMPNSDAKGLYPAHIVSVSGCRDDQASASAFFGGEGWRGALTLALQQMLQTHPDLTTQAVLSKCCEFLQKNKLTQKPQMCSSHDTAQVLSTLFF
jgi:metacaspase-1